MQFELQIILFLLVGMLFIVILYLGVNIAVTVWLRFNNPLHYQKENDRAIYLTFDDGIDSAHTPLLLDLLKRYHIKATFFIMAETIEKNVDILQRMKNEGHIVGLHSWSHKNLIIQNPFTICSDFHKSIHAFVKHGLTPIYYRPPWGHMSLLGMCSCKKHGLKIVLWNVIVQDWEKKTTHQIICEKLENKVKENAVICLHDGRGKEDAPQKTIQALCEMIPKWIEEGYHFETIDWLYKKNSN